MRARGEGANKTYGIEDIIEQNGVVKGSYDEVQLPKIRAFNVLYKQPSMLKPAEAFEVKSDALPPSLEWGQVLINVKAAPVGPTSMFEVAWPPLPEAYFSAISSVALAIRRSTCDERRRTGVGWR